jgi:iron complex outermembrane receptor protein
MTIDDIDQPRRTYFFKHAKVSTLALFISLASAPLVYGAEGEAATAGSASALNEIVVTAQRRSESIQDVPVSVTAISGDMLEKLGATGFGDYARTIPNLSFGTGNGFGVTNARAVTIRGVAGANTTSFYINDTPVPLSLDPRVLDVERVEALSGPQGTLFGSSAMGGTVRVITRAADTKREAGFVDASGFDVNHGGGGYDVSGTYNIPLIANELALKVSAYNSYQPGVFTRQYGIATTPGYLVTPQQGAGRVDHVGDDFEFGGMATLTYTPESVAGLTITPMLIYQKARSNGLPLADYSPDNLVQIRPLNVAEGTRDQWNFSSLTAKYQAGFGSFISSSTWFHRQAFDDEDGTEVVSTGVFGTAPCTTNQYCASPSPSFVNTDSFTQEVRFESAFTFPLQVVAGGYYTYGSAHTIQGETTPYDATGAPAFVEDIPSNNRELAEFVDFSYDVTKALQLSAGVRESELRDFSAYIADGWINGGPSNVPSGHSEHALTPRYTAKYRIDENAMIYADAAKGFRIGGQNGALPPVCDGDLLAAGYTPGQNSSFLSDSLWSYELGSKNTWFGGRMNTRVAAYRIDWSKIQQSVLLPCTYHITENAGAATSTGAELEADIAPLHGLDLSLSLGYDNAKITASPANAAFVAGQPLNGVPKLTASLLGEYTRPTAFGSAFVRAQYSFTGRSVSFANNPAGITRDPYSLVNLRFGVATGPWEAALFTKNLFDVRANLGDEQSEISALAGRPRFLIAQPRTIGIEFRRTFD